ncbi:TRAP transporter permease [Halobacteriaceae archaeon GCM10025711]
MSTSTPDDPDDTISAEEREQLIQELEQKRSLRGAAAVAVSLIAVLFSAFQMWIAARSFIFRVPVPFYGTVDLGSLQLLQVNAIHVTFALVLTFLLFPPNKSGGRLAKLVPSLERDIGADHPVTRASTRLRSVVRWAFVDRTGDRITPFDAVLVALSLMAGGYIVTDFDEIRQLRVFGLQAGRPIQEVFNVGIPIPFDGTFYPVDAFVQVVSAVGIPLNEVSYAMVIGAVGALLVLEATRRALGFYLMVIVGSFIVYARYGYLIPPDVPYISILSIKELTWATIIQNLWFNTENGVFGIPVQVSVQFIYIFILFGAFLEMSGAGQWFIDLAYSATGTRKGGPAKASILASGFMGTISGSSIANTVTTGAFTIPLMKRTGYRPEFAGAVEASASSGGQILPPVMGAAAFLIVEYTLTPFPDVITAAAIPAVVFFFGVWVMVHLEASRANIGGLSKEDVVEFVPHARRGWFYLVPLVLLLHFLIVERLSVARSAWFTLIAVMALVAFISAYNRRTRIPLVGVITALTAAEFAAFLTRGVPLLDALGGASAGGIPASAAAFAALGKLGWITMAVSVATLLLRPRMAAPLLDLDEQVDDAVETGAAALDRPSLTGNRAFTFGTFVLKSMDSGARTATTVVVAVAAAGIIPGVISATGLGPNLTLLIKTIAGGSIVILLVVTALSSIILGMGMPTTVTYIILVSMLGPAISELGIPLLAAHLFILYFGVIADITPPVAVAAYAASGIAKSDEFWTGVQAFSLSLNKAIVPFAFVLTPGILLLRTDQGGEPYIIGMADVLDVGYFVPEVLIPVIGVFVGVLALGATVIGYLYTNVTGVDRGLFALAALLLMAPGLLFNAVFDLLSLAGLAFDGTLMLDLALRGVGAVLFAFLVVKNKREAGTRPEAAPGGAEAPETA